MRRRSIPGLWIGVGLLAAASAGADGDRAVAGRVVDADTGEPLAGVLVFAAVPAERRAADVQRFDRVREARTDAHGRFRFEAEPSGFLSCLTRSSGPAPRYHAYHESYGLVWGRENAGAIELSLRDAHLRAGNANQLCNDGLEDALRSRIRERACPPADPTRFADGRPRAEGEVDARGRRTGPWSFFREDGSTIARGHYVAGAAARGWEFFPPAPVRAD